MAYKQVNDELVELSEAEENEINEEWSRWDAGDYDRAMFYFRIERDQKLADSDWTQMADVALTTEKDTQWRSYRKSLRDLPAGLNTLDDVNNVVWPSEPS